MQDGIRQLPFDDAPTDPVGLIEPLSPSGVWTEDMARRLKVLYHASPLFDLGRNASRNDDLSDYDVVVIAFKFLDVLAEETGLGDGISADQAIESVIPLLAIMDRNAQRTPNPERQRKVARRVLDYLLNRSDGSRKFEIDYMSSIRPDGSAEQAVLKFRLVEEVNRTWNEVVLRLSPEAVNLIFRMLAVDLESSMAATEAILEHLIRRGRFDDALNSAQQALKQAGVYRLKINAFRRNVRSDIMLELGSNSLNEAMEFVRERQEKEKILYAQICARREDLRKGDASQGEEDVRYNRLSEILTLITQCQGIYASLVYDIMDAQREFTQEHGKQCLRPKPVRGRYPNLMIEQAPPIFLAPLAKVEPGLLAFYQRLAGHRPPERFSFNHLMNPLKRPLPSEDSLEESEETAIQPEPYTAQIRPEDWVWVQAFIADVKQRTRLSDLLKEVGQQDNLNGPRRLALIIEVIRGFVFGAEKPGVKLSISTMDDARPLKWRDLEFYGDDMWVEPLASGKELLEEGGV